MKKLLIGFGMLVLVLGLAGAASAASITYNYYNPNDGSGLTSVHAGELGFTEETFDAPLQWLVEAPSNGAIVSGTQETPTGYATPVGDTSEYLTVPANLSNTPITYTAILSTTAQYNYLGLYWGSIDTYNHLYIYDGTTLVATIDGSTVLADLYFAGDRFSSLSNRYVEITTEVNFNKVVFESSSYAFESDNVVYGTVPEPATMLTLGLALLGLGALKRKFEL